MVPDKIRLIADSEVLKVPIRDNGEPLVDLLTYSSELQVDTSRERVQQVSPSISLVRRGVADRLLEAQRLLPEGVRFWIKEGHRPLSVQRMIFESYLAKLLTRYPAWTDPQRYEAACELIAPPDIVPPHSTGGAVDLTLRGSNGAECDMGTYLNAAPWDTERATYTRSPGITEEARRHREWLITALSEVGFVNYPTEWWHWSFGDRYWAFHRGEKTAIYGSVDP